jgi:hypothetical protein
MDQLRYVKGEGVYLWQPLEATTDTYEPSSCDVSYRRNAQGIFVQNGNHDFYIVIRCSSVSKASRTLSLCRTVSRRSVKSINVPTTRCVSILPSFSSIRYSDTTEGPVELSNGAGFFHAYFLRFILTECLEIFWSRCINMTWLQFSGIQEIWLHLLR